MADEDAMLEAEVQRIQEQLREVRKRKKERYATVMRERNSQGTSRNEYDTPYYSDDSEPEPGSADALAKGMMAVRDRAMFNLQKLEEKYLAKEKNRKPSDMIEFGLDGRVYYPDDMPANQQQMHVDKIFRDDLNFGKGAISAPHNSKEVFRGDSRAWKESVKRDEMYREHKRKQKKLFPKPIFEDDDSYYRKILVKPDRRRSSKMKKEEHDDESSDEDLDDEEFSDGNTSDDLSSEVFSSSEEEDEEEEEEDRKEHALQTKSPYSSNTDVKTTPQRSRKPGSSELAEEDKSESRAPKESRTPNSRIKVEVLETSLSEKKPPSNQYNSRSSKTLQKNTPELQIPQKRKCDMLSPKTQKIGSPQLKRVSPKTIKQESATCISQSLKVETSETPTTRNRSRIIKTEIAECSSSTPTIIEDKTKFSTSITAKSETLVSRGQPEIIDSALETMREVKDSDGLKPSTRPRYSKQNNSEIPPFSVKSTPKAASMNTKSPSTQPSDVRSTRSRYSQQIKSEISPVSGKSTPKASSINSKSPSTQPSKSNKANNTNKDIDFSTTSKQSVEDQDIMVIKSVRGTPARRSQNRKRTLDQHWKDQPVKKTPKIDFETESSSSLDVEMEEVKPARRKSNRKSRDVSEPVEKKIWGQEIDFSEFGNKVFGVSTIYHNKLKITFFEVWCSAAILMANDHKEAERFEREFRRWMASNKKSENDVKAGYDFKRPP